MNDGLYNFSYLPLILESENVETHITTETVETTETTETTTTAPVPVSDTSTGLLIGMFLPPFFIIIFLISVILVLALKKS